MSYVDVQKSESSCFFPQGLPNPSRNLKKSQKPSGAHASNQWFWGLREKMATVERDMHAASSHNLPVLIIGETGSGKEVIAQQLHELRLKRLSISNIEGPFIAVNSGAIPEALVESILFGHERGSFTSARDRQYGKFEIARRGTLFLDEIQTLSTSTQIKLLRVLQNKELDRLGSRRSSVIECQVVAATNIPLEHLVDKELFRKDLYYRLNICPIYIPALRQRKEDLPTIIKGLLERIRHTHSLRAFDISAHTYEILLNYNWPGNIRELEHALLYASLHSSDIIEAEALPPHITGRLNSYLAEGNWKV